MPDGGGTQQVRAVLPGTRALLVVFCVLTLLAVVSLFVLSAATDRFFAWTIQPPLTAAYLGAGYAAGAVLVLLSLLRSRTWADARVPVLTILVFTLFTLLATLIHLDRFHIGQSGLARFAAWLWLAVYVLVPPSILAMIVAQLRAPGGDPERHLPMPRWLEVLLVVQGLALLAIGITLFVAPATSPALWPWPLSPLTARAIGAWQIAFGFAALLAVRTGDLARLRTAAVAYTLFGVLELVALARYPGDVTWGSPAFWGFLAIVAAVLVTGAYGWWAARRV